MMGHEVARCRAMFILCRLLAADAVAASFPYAHDRQLFSAGGG